MSILLTPDVYVFSDNRFAGVDVDELYIKMEGNSSLVFDDVFSDTFACDVCKSSVSALRLNLRLCNIYDMTYNKVQESLPGLAHRMSCQKTEPTDRHQRQYDLVRHGHRS